MDELIEKKLYAGVSKLGIDLGDIEGRKIIAFLQLLEKWNEHYNLTSLRTREEILIKHFLDSLSINSFLGEKKIIADVGCGAGFPGVPLAIVNSDKNFTLIEGNKKKCAFMRQAKQELELDNISVVASRAEDTGGQFEIIVCRALGSLKDIVNWTKHLWQENTHLLAMKGKNPEDELRALPKNYKVSATHRIDVPWLEAERHLIDIERKTIE